jgi:hypothetical protein
MRDYERALLPIVRALDDPDLGKGLSAKLRKGLQEFLGSWQLESLSICESEEDIQLMFDRLRVPLEQRHIDEPIALLSAMFQDMGNSKPVTNARKRVRELIELLG